MTRETKPQIDRPPELEALWKTFSAQLDELAPERTITMYAAEVGDAEDTVAQIPLIPIQKDELPRLDLSDGDFDRLEVLGEGGMGLVEQAFQRSLRRDVALKVLRPGKRDEATVQALLAEAVFTGALEHPNIVPVHQLGLDVSGDPVMVMKRVEGVEWHNLLEDPEHPQWKKVAPDGDRIRFHVEVLIHLCRAVAYAHSRGVIHRDIKPHNVMIGAFGEVLLMDWGVALRLEDAEHVRAIVGTPAYMAPEMADPEKPLNEQTDVYLLGATLHHVLTGEPRHQAETMFGVLLEIYASKPYDYSDGVPAELATLCSRACAREPEDRLPSADAFRVGLQEFLQHRSARHLTERAEALLESLLREEANEALFARHFAECRFAFQHALREWPEHESAQEGLGTLLRLGTRRALERRDAVQAAVLLSEMETPDPELQTELEALQAELEAERGELEALRTEHDVRVGIRTRSRYFIFGGAIVSSLALMWGQLDKRGIVDFDHGHTLAAGGSFLGMLIIGLFVYWDDLMSTTLNRRFTFSALFYGFSVLVSRTTCWALDLHIRISLIFDLLVTVLVVGMLGATVDLRFLGVAVTAFIALIVALLLPPGYELEIQSMAVFVGFSLVGLVWKDVEGEQENRLDS